MSKHLARVACERINLRPALLTPAFESNFILDMQSFASADFDEERANYEQRGQQAAAAFGLSDARRDKPFWFAEGLAIIPVSGTLLNRFGYSWGFVTGYNYIRAMLNFAIADDDVRGIILDVNSYGGECAGCFELADDIFAARAAKPIIALVDSNSYSAGYAIASAASKVILTPSGGAGSIGVVAMHVDMSKMLEDWGLKITFIHSGAHKVDGNSFQALPEPVRAAIQADVDESREEFAALVARNRSLEHQVVYDTEAQTYSAKAALQLGLIDEVMPPSKAVTAFLAELSGSTDSQETTMSVTTKPGAEANAEAQANDAELTASTRKAERERIGAILGCEEAAGRTKLATHLAMNTEMSVEDARGMLAAAASETPPAAPAPAAAVTPATSAFEQAMNSGQQPNLQADGAPEDGKKSRSAEILEAQALATGVKLGAK